MQTDKLREIIQHKNDQREREVLRTAEIIIEGIVNEQKKIANSEFVIKELREDLKKLEVTQINPDAILGQ